MVTAMERIYAVLPLRPAIVRELIEELRDMNTQVARSILRVEIESGRMTVGYDGKLHKGSV